MKTHTRSRFGKLPQITLALAVALGVSAGVLPSTTGLGTTSAHAAEVGTTGESLQDYVARGAVQDAPHNMTTPSPGVSRIKMVKGQMNGNKVRGRVPAADEATLTYKVRVPKQMHELAYAEVVGKMPGLAGVPANQSPWYASAGGKMKPDSWSIRLHPRNSDLRSVGYPWWDAYIYAGHAAGKDYSGQWGIQVPITEGLNGAGRKLAMPVDRWFEIKVRVKMNTPGVENGELDIWIDGTQGIKLRDVQWRNSGVTTPINVLMADVFFNNPGAPLTGYVDFADFTVTPGPLQTTPVLAPVLAPAPTPTPTPAPTPTPEPTPVVVEPGTRTTVASTTFVSDTAYRVVRNGWGPVEKDRSNGEKSSTDGRTLTIAGTKYAKGLGVHAASEVVVPVNGAQTFTTKVGVDSEVGTAGSVVFQVFDGTTKLADSGVMRGGQAAKTLSVDVAGKKEIRLVVTDSGNGNAKDHADWADAKLIG